MNNWLFFSLIIFSSFFFTELIRQYTLKKHLVDIPNNRSSHSSPIPRGGGLSIVITFLASISFIDSLSLEIYIVLLGAGLTIAAIGFWDDLGHIAARWRLLAHFLASLWILYWLGGISKFHFLGISLDLGWLGILVVVIFLVWLLNLFNFMDGIDGIAASETIFVACGGAYFSWLNGFEDLSFISLIFAASTMGFLILNWAPAKIFMGDVGSGFLGIVVGVIAYANILKGMSIWLWFILLAVFLVDSSLTLLRRILNSEKWYEAHCSHAYQNAARKWGHKRVTVSVIIINIFWLFPLATISYSKPEFTLWCILLAFIPLIILALKFKAGIKEE